MQPPSSHQGCVPLYSLATAHSVDGLHPRIYGPPLLAVYSVPLNSENAEMVRVQARTMANLEYAGCTCQPCQVT
ncbi:hypothetical protein TMatcc_009160 [Talaromyces marneffei ATCC 18224]